MTTEERLERIERMLEVALARGVYEEGRAYTDEEVRARLGGISQTTLWEIRDKGLLKSSYLFPGSRVRRTTERQLQDYLDYLSSTDAAKPVEEGDDDQFDQDLDAKLDELGARRARRRTAA